MAEESTSATVPNGGQRVDNGANSNATFNQRQGSEATLQFTGDAPDYTRQKQQPYVDPDDLTLSQNPQVQDIDVEQDAQKEEFEAGSGEPFKQEANLPPPKDPNLVEFDGPDDPDNPMNWKKSYKWMLTIIMALQTFCITFASSVFSTATVPTAVLFHVSEEVMILGTSLFVMGFTFGPIMWGPMSELYGRRIPLLFGVFVMSTFEIGVAVAQNIYTVMLCRYFAGLFGCAPLAVVGGALADFWGPVDRGVAVCLFAAATFIGPVAGPIMGGFITDSYLGWRWTQYITMIMGYFFFSVGLILIPETYAPVILQARAKRLRHATKNWALHAKADENLIDGKVILEKYLFLMLFLEPILLLITIYMGLIYGILYLFFEAFPISFQEERGWNEGVGALPFLSITIGVILGGLVISHLTTTRFARKLQKHGQVIPEERLPPMIIGPIVLPVGLFWWAWTSYPSISPWPQIIAGVPTGMGILMIFIQGLNYIIDVYKMNANSAIAGNTFVRSFLGAGFPLFATAMYHNLGTQWATCLLALLTVAMIPVPVLFFVYGKRIRAMSRWAPT